MEMAVCHWGAAERIATSGFALLAMTDSLLYINTQQAPSVHGACWSAHLSMLILNSFYFRFSFSFASFLFFSRRKRKRKEESIHHYNPKYSSISAALVSGLALGKTFSTVPSGAMTKVLRTTPMETLP